MIKKSWVLVIVILLLSVALVACGSKPPATQPPVTPAPGTEGPAFDGELLIGIMVPTTGSEATYGKDMENAINLAVEEINAKGGLLGKKVVTTTGDDGCDPQMASAAASKLVSSDVVAVVGGYCSGATLPTLKIYADAKIPMVVPAANSTKIAEENQGWAFQVNSPGYHQAEKATQWFATLGHTKVALVHQGDGFSEDLANLTKANWEDKGNQVVAYEVVNKGEQDYSALVTKIKSSGAEVVYWTAYHADGALLIMQLRQGGYTGDIVVGDGSSSDQLLEIAGQAGEGVYCTSPPIVDFLPAASSFIQNYTAKWKQSPGPYSGLSYDSANLLFSAIEKANSVDGDAIRAILVDTKDFPTLSGNITFTPELTLVNSNFIMLKGENGKWVLAE
ncbi:MAG: branched-chain amino acid ABC transporter substrate-binding protein [Clostridiales bacterium]|jgi:branched-chain amino acid transport system substrate-binding protein|nr:branched-chain amino acid ABC transporter substrate-binding protein [Clostridiales bacterium]